MTESDWFHKQITDAQLAAVNATPDRLFQALYPHYAKHRNDQTVTFQRLDHCVRADISGTRWYLPDARTVIRLTEIGRYPQHRVWNTYRDVDYCDVEQGDTVIDVGAYIGEFSRHAATRAGRVIAAEPAPDTLPCLARNLQQYANTELVTAPLWKASEHKAFAHATDGTEHSLVGVDDGETVETPTVATTTLADVIKRRNLSVDFLKVDAEGAEPEVLAGLGAYRPEKIAVSVTPERKGVSPRERVKCELTERGYTCRERDQILFARRNA